MVYLTIFVGLALASELSVRKIRGGAREKNLGNFGNAKA